MSAAGARPSLRWYAETPPLSQQNGVRRSHSTASKVVHFCTSTAAARQELPIALGAQPLSNPQTSLGSNAKRGAARRKPTAIFVGAGFDREDYEGFRRDVGEVQGITWVREEKCDIEGLDNPNNWMVRDGLGRVPKPEVLIKSVSKCLKRDLLGDE